MGHRGKRESEIRKNMLIAVMLTIVVCGIMLTMYFINNRLMHPENKGNRVNKEKLSGNHETVAKEDLSFIDIHSVLTLKPGI